MNPEQTQPMQQKNVRSEVPLAHKSREYIPIHTLVYVALSLPFIAAYLVWQILNARCCITIDITPKRYRSTFEKAVKLLGLLKASG